jgi:hypothetical protein
LEQVKKLIEAQLPDAFAKKQKSAAKKTAAKKSVKKK